MNRTFTAPLTPARARLLVRLQKHTPFVIDERVVAHAEIDRLTPDQFAEVGLELPEDQDAVQFILDSNFRAGIPVPRREEHRGAKIVKAAIKLAGISDEDVVAIDTKLSPFTARYEEISGGTSKRGSSLNFDRLLPLRKKLLIFNIDSRLAFDIEGCADLIGLMFPRILCVGALALQYEMSFSGSATTTCDRMGEFLYPAIQQSISKSGWKKTQSRTLLAMGVYPDLVADKERML